MHTTSWFIIPAFSAVGVILITLKHGLSRIIKRMGRLILTAFIFHLTQPGGIFGGCVSIRMHDEYYAIECLETLEA